MERIYNKSFNSHLFNKLIVFVCLSLFSSYSIAKQLSFSSGTKLDQYQPIFVSSVLEEAFNRINYDFSVSYYPSPRALVLSNTGVADGELHRVANLHSLTEGKYPNLLRIDPAISHVQRAIFAKKSIEQCDMAALNDASIAFRRGHKLTEKELLSEQYNFSRIFQVTTDLQAFQILTMNRVDFVESSIIVGQQLLKKLNKESEFKPCLIKPSVALHAYIHKKHQKLIPDLQKALMKMKLDGTIETLRQRAKKSVQ